MMQTRFSLTFLGTGNAWSKPPVNFQTNALVTVNGNRWLIDCGSLCPLALHDAGIAPETLCAIYISHLHADHVLGLDEILLHNYFCAQKRTSLYLSAEHFTRFSGIPGADIWENYLRATLETPLLSTHPPRLLTLEHFSDIHLMDEQTVTPIADLPTQLMRVEHVPNRPCFGLILDNRVAYTSDSLFSFQRIENLLSRGIETIFHDAAFGRPTGTIHATVSELCTLPRDFAEHIILMHYPDIRPDDEVKRARDFGFRFAHKGETFEF